MLDDIAIHEAYARAALLLSSKACGTPMKKLVVPSLSEVVYAKGSQSETRITTIVTNVLAVNPKANHVLYISRGECCSGIEAIRITDTDEEWAGTIQRIAGYEGKPRKKIEREILDFMKGLNPFLELLEPAFRAYSEGTDLEGVKTTKELIHFISFEELARKLLPEQEVHINWREWLTKVDPEKEVEDATHGIIVRHDGQEAVFNHKFLHNYFMYIIDDSCPAGYDVAKVIQTYSLLRLIESTQFVKGYESVQRVPIIINSNINLEEDEIAKRAYRILHEATYDFRNIGDMWTNPFLKKIQPPYGNMDHGREIVNMYMRILEARTGREKRKEEKEMAVEERKPRLRYGEKISF